MPSPLRPLLQMAAILALAALAALAANSLAGPSRRLGRISSPQPTPVAPPSPRPEVAKPVPSAPAKPAPPAPRAAPPIRFEWTPEQPSREISSPEAAEAFRQGFPFLDARRSGEYREGHIRGALGLSVWESDIDERLTRFDAMGHPLKAPLVLYCSGGDCHDSQLLASRLMGLGYRHLLIYRAGYPDWVAKARATRKGEQP